MGIQSLLRFMKPFIEPVHIEKYSGKRIGIDAYSWLHKGAYSCSMELCLGSRSEGAKRFLKYFMHHIDLLRHYKITPVVVFDGGSMPCKAATENERHRRRETNLESAKEKLKQGDVRGAVELFQRAVRITPSMAHQLIQILRKENVEFVVAPYEADAQLAYLSTLDADKGGVDAVITEDSDLIAYFCQAVIFKMDRYGNGEELLLDRVFNSVSNELSFKNFDKELFTGMCVLAGCDFLPSISGIGIKRAYSLILKYRNLDRVLSALKLDKRYQIPEDYPESFRKAVAVFHHATVYDAETKKLKHMKPLQHKDMPSLNGDLDFLGPELPPSMATAIAEGHLNPLTMEAFDYFCKIPSRADTSTVDNCITIFPAKRMNNEDISYRDQGSQMSLTQESCITIISDQQVGDEEITVTRQVKVDQKKYMKEALSLGKLIAPLESQQQVEIHMERSETPNNNPFKRRKLGDINPIKKSSSHQVPVLLDAEKSVDVLCSSSPESQETVESKPNNKSKAKHPKSTKTKTDNKNSILRFFQPL
ncbi:XPG/Rad2 endonuclease protein [Dioscorea alata]|uniref:XPG/Rad2 endonuclease protein n=1 Tax=Dioscorea alata TaxID=55571 RepID=A0ACB7UE47_DIOAL|nr:XPG/Rad2 endonuclease protein [Dioscorea alata]